MFKKVDEVDATTIISSEQPTGAVHEIFNCPDPFGLAASFVTSAGVEQKSCPVLILPIDAVLVVAFHEKSVYEVPDPDNCSDSPNGVDELSATPISVDVKPFASPAVAVKLPS